MARVSTTYDPTAVIGAAKTVEYEPGVWFCYGAEKNGVSVVIAIIEKSKTGYVIDAESATIAAIPSTTPTAETPKPLYDIYVRAYGKTALHVGVAVVGKTYFGHRVISSALSTMSWTDIRKREYQISATVVDPEPLNIDALIDAPEVIRG